MNAPSAEQIPELNNMFRLQWEEAQDSYVLLYPEGMVKLSPSAAEILKRIDGSTSVDGIVQDLEQAFQGADLRNDVIAFLRQARENGWIKL